MCQWPIMLSILVPVCAFSQEDPLGDGPGNRPPKIEILEPRDPGPGPGDLTRELLDAMIKRSQAGDREAMKWLIRENLADGVTMPPENVHGSWGIPRGDEYVTMLLEVRAECPGENRTRRDELIAGYVLQWLGVTRDPRAMALLETIARNDSDEWSDRSRALRHLAVHFPARGAVVLAELAKHPNMRMRVSVANAAQYLKDAAAEGILSQLTLDDDRTVRASAKSYLEFWRTKHGPSTGSRDDPGKDRAKDGDPMQRSLQDEGPAPKQPGEVDSDGSRPDTSPPTPAQSGPSPRDWPANSLVLRVSVAGMVLAVAIVLVALFRRGPRRTQVGVGGGK